MAEHFPPDRFDTLPEHPGRVGAHRARPPRFARLRFALWSALAVVTLSAVGIGAVIVLDNGVFSSADDTAVPTPSVAPTVDASVPVTVLNGTPTDTLDESAAEELQAAGFTVGSAANADKSDVEKSVVSYTAPLYEGAARGVAQALGITEVRQSSTFAAIGSNITVVIGADFVPKAVG